MKAPSIKITELTAGAVGELEDIGELFARAFEDQPTYLSKRPRTSYLKGLLEQESFIAIAAKHEGNVVGGVIAYELMKFEQERSEIYIYDLAVEERHRRKGIATAMIQEVRKIAAARNAWVVYVQADEEDVPAMALYSRLGKRADVWHFEIDPVAVEQDTVHGERKPSS